ncbi:MMPL family transporter [Salinirubellus salinus]|uniref:MMPL family transporter n=1 Tax=Salinirubellus salinus TaxID=1364945 RepID=A0A9E7UAC5_9EURY|nr:MMPL family transporter [Salinirubellus salinus]UWM54108.1 MMPL family transporter [Salinirubellus salinus]
MTDDRTGLLDRLAATVTGAGRRPVLVAVLLATLVLGAGAPAVELSTSLEEFRGGTAEADATDYVEANLSGGESNVTQSLVVVRTTLPETAPRRDRNVLTREAYLEYVAAQRALEANETVARTLHPEQRPLSIATVVAVVAIERERETDVDDVRVEPRPSLDAQAAALRELSDLERQRYTSYAVGTVLSDVSHTWPDGGGFAFVPTTYEANQKTATATAFVVSHHEETDPENLTAAQTAAGAVVNAHLGPDREAIVVGDGMVNDELRRSSVDSLRIVGPVALLLVVLLLGVAYRDAVDAALTLVGVGTSLLWTFGYMGWAGVTFNQLFVAVPVLLMGLSIDYAIHVFMRQREERAARPPGGPPSERAGRSAATTREPGAGKPSDGVAPSMRVAVGSVGAALALVTLTTATGFLSNLASGVGPIRAFGVVSAVGILATFVVFGAFLPALKVEVDTFLEARGHDRTGRAFGTEGRLRTLLAVPVAFARSTPWAVVVLTLLVTAGGVYGATQVGDRFEQDDLLVDDGDVPGWTDDLPTPMQPSNYTAQANLDYVEANEFVYDGTYTELLVRGEVTAPDTLRRVKRASDVVNDTGVALVLPDGRPATRSPLTMMHAVADRNESFAATLEASDEDGDGVPDRDLETLYDAFYAAEPEAARTVLDRRGGEYVALRVKAPVNGTESEPTITSEVRNATTPVQGDGLRAIATGQPVQNQAVATQLLDTVTQALAITLAVVLGLLVAVYRRAGHHASLGVVTILPVTFAVSWILGTMALLGVPFNVMTALITSFTVGFGVDYSIHVTERYVQELEGGASTAEAVETAALGTGGALLGSAVTDVVGVGVLAFAILEPLQQFGVVTAITIAYSFLASVVVLPSLLVLWTRRYGPSGVAVGPSRAREREPMSVDD